MNECSDMKFSLPQLGPDGDYPYRGLTPVRVTQLPNVPCLLQLHKRSPKQILENKSFNASFLKTLTTNSKEFEFSVDLDDLSLIEEEIQMKLFYLSVIELLSQGFSMEDCQMYHEMEKYRSSLAHLQIQEQTMWSEISGLEVKLQAARLLLRSRREINVDSLNYCAYGLGERPRIQETKTQFYFGGHQTSRLKILDNRQMAKLISE